MVRRTLWALFIAGCLAASALLALTVSQLRERMREPENNPRAFLRRGRRPDAHTLVVCAGDSLTHGVASANYVEMLQQRLGPDGYEFVNAGINGNLAYNVLQRLDEIIASQPDVVTLLIGTNDVNATFSQKLADQYRAEQSLPERPTLEWYRQNLAAIIGRLQAETHARIAVLDLPMLGENLDSEMNHRVATYNAALRAITAEKQVTYLPLHDRLCALLPPGHTPPSYQGRVELVAQASVKRHVLHKSWNTVSAEHGLHLLTDHIHLNDRAATEIAALIGEYLTQQG